MPPSLGATSEGVYGGPQGAASDKASNTRSQMDSERSSDKASKADPEGASENSSKRSTVDTTNTICDFGSTGRSQRQAVHKFSLRYVASSMRMGPLGPGWALSSS